MTGSPRRRSPGRRRLPPRPTYESARAASEPGVAAAAAPSSAAHARDVAVAERETRFMIRELRRVAMVSGACFGLLALLTVLDRLS